MLMPAFSSLDDFGPDMGNKENGAKSLSSLTLDASSCDEEDDLPPEDFMLSLDPLVDLTNAKKHGGWFFVMITSSEASDVCVTELCPFCDTPLLLPHTKALEQLLISKSSSYRRQPTLANPNHRDAPVNNPVCLRHWLESATIDPGRCKGYPISVDWAEFRLRVQSLRTDVEELCKRPAGQWPFDEVVGALSKIKLRTYKEDIFAIHQRFGTG